MIGCCKSHEWFNQSECFISFFFLGDLHYENFVAISAHGLVVMGGESRLTFFEFKSQHQIQNG